ncbi:MAG: hypothetical protein AAF135_08645 [Bacteroidota bacterium]
MKTSLLFLPFLLMLGLPTFGQYELEKKLFTEEYERAKSNFKDAAEARLIEGELKNYLPAFVSYLDRINSYQQVVNQRIDSLEEAESWPQRLEDYASDPRFTIISQVRYASTRDGTGIKAVIRYEAQDRIAPPQEISSLFEGLKDFPPIIQSKMTLGRKNGIQIPVELRPDSVLCIYDGISMFYGKKQALPSVYTYKKTHAYAPQYTCIVTQTAPTSEIFIPKRGLHQIEIPIYYGMGDLLKYEAGAELRFDGLNTPILENQDELPYSNALVLLAGEPLNVTWVVGISNESFLKEADFTFETFWEQMNPRTKQEYEYRLFVYKKDVEGVISFFREMREEIGEAIEAGEAPEGADKYIVAFITTFEDIQRKLNDKENASLYHLALAQLESKRYEQDRDNLYIYDQLSQSLQADPTNVDAWKLLVTSFPLDKIAPTGTTYPPQNTEAQLVQLDQLQLNQDSLDHWLDQIYTYGKDSVETYEFLINVYRRNYETGWGWNCEEPGCAKAMQLCNEMVEKFPQDIRAHSLKAEFIVWQRITQLLSDDRWALSNEKDYLKEIGEKQSPLPLLFEEQSTSFSLQEENVVTDSQEVARIRKSAEAILRERAAMQEQVRTLAAMAKVEAQMVIDLEPNHWMGYWLRGMARYWLGEKVKAQEDYCRSKDLFNPLDQELGHTRKPTSIQPYYEFKECIVDKM